MYSTICIGTYRDREGYLLILNFHLQKYVCIHVCVLLSHVGLEMNSTLYLLFYRHYRMSKTLKNAPFVDNSLKWAGGGYVSNAVDLVKLGNALLSIYHYPKEDSDEHKQGLLKPSTVTKMWSPIVNSNLKNFHYGWGWLVSSPRSVVGTTPHPKVVMHTGGAVGATSILLIQPRERHSNQSLNLPNSNPQGVVVAVLFNLESVKEVDKLAISIAEHFSAE